MDSAANSVNKYRSKSMTALLITNILGVFNNNFLKGLVCFISIGWVSRDYESEVLMYATSLLVLPYILFSPLAGRLAKTRLKTNVLITAKKAEILIIGFSISGFFFESLFLVFFSLFLIGFQSALISPAKFGLIRDISGDSGIANGTGLMDMTSFFSLLFATFIAGIVADMSLYRSQGILVIFALAAVSGVYSAIRIKAVELPVERDNKSLNPLTFLKEAYLFGNTIKGLNIVILGSGLFWFIASMLQMNLIIFCQHEYRLSASSTSIVIGLITSGMAIGCLVSGLISKSALKLWTIPVGGIALSAIMTVISLFVMNHYIFASLLFLFAFFSGLFKITINAWLQKNVAGREQGNMLAYGNMVDFIFVLFSAATFRFVEFFSGTFAVFAVLAVVSWANVIIVSMRVPGVMSYKSLNK